MSPILLNKSQEELKIRDKLVNLTENANGLLADAEDGKVLVQDLNKISAQSLDLVKNHDRVELLMLDATVMETVVKAFNVTARILTPKKFTVSLDDYAKRLFRSCNIIESQASDNSPMLIARLGENTVKQHFHDTPSIDVMLGHLQVSEPMEKPQKPRQKRIPDKIEPVKNPELVQCVEGRNIEATVLKIHKKLSSSYEENAFKPINFFKFVLNPNCYAKSIENIFHFAFLINSERSNIFLDANNIPMIEPNKAKDIKEGTREGKAALVIHFNKKDYKLLLDALEVREPMLQLDDKSSNPSTLKRKN